MHLVNKATKRPQKPSAWLGFDQYVSPDQCLDFDLAVEQFDDWELERTERTRRERVPPHDPKAPMHRDVRVFTTLRQVLGYDEAEGAQSEPDNVEALSADEADLLHKIEAGEIRPEDLALLDP